MILAGPAIAIAGIVRAVHNGQVHDKLGRRAPDWPLTLAPNETRVLDLFVPLAPSPTRVELDYAAGGAERKLDLDVHQPLDGLQVPVRAGATTPK